MDLFDQLEAKILEHQNAMKALRAENETLKQDLAKKTQDFENLQKRLMVFLEKMK